MSATSARLSTTIREIDAANASDPRRIAVGGETRPQEVVYAERMSAALSRLYPQAGEHLQIAARAQHIRRWEISREQYPLGREGYNAWRAAAREHHAKLAVDIMTRAGYPPADSDHVASIIRKQHLKSDADAQALENVVGIVFLEHYAADFAASHPDYDEAKLIGILKKTFRKMDALGIAAAKRLDLPPALRHLVDTAAG